MKDDIIHDSVKIFLNKTTLASKLALYFVLFSIGIFIILWLMQVVFLQAYYGVMKKFEIDSIVVDIKKQYDPENIETVFDSISFKNGIIIFVWDLDSNIILYNSENRDIIGNSRVGGTNILPFNEILKEIQNSKRKESKFVIPLNKYNSEIYINASILKDTNYCLIVAGVTDPIDATTNVLKNQLLCATIVSLICASVISIILSKNIAKPITVMEEKAKQLAKGNYNIKFEKAGYAEIDNLADTLNYATKELEKTDNLRKELIANVSHDLKTPLTMIKAYSEMIKDLYVNNQTKREESLNTIIDETDRLTKLVNDMLDLSKLESNKMGIIKENFDIVEICDYIVQNLKIMKENEEIMFNISSTSEHIIVNADKTRIEQVMYNLLWNAIKYSIENKEIKIQIEEKDNKVKVSVVDNGTGISEEELPYIWDRYYKANKNFERTKEGSGLGLSIVKNIFELHDAQYGVTSKKYIGSTFWFELNKVEKQK